MKILHTHTAFSVWIIRAISLFLLTIYCTSSSAENNASSHNQEWVVVLEDPRPARLQGWKSNRYSNGASYSTPDLKRLGAKFAKNNGLKLKQEWFIESLAVYCLIVEFTQDTQATLDKLEKKSRVKWVQKSNDFNLLSANTTQQDSIGNTATNHLKPMSYDGQGTVIAMIDSGVDRQHQDLFHSIKSVSNFVITNSKATGGNTKAENHGTAIAGVLVAQPNSKLGLSGVAPAAKLLAFRGCWEETSKAKTTHCNTLSLARALDAVIKSQPNILNLSLSGPYDPLLNKLIDKVIENQTIVVAAFDPIRSNKQRFPSYRDGILIVRANNINPEFDSAFTAPGSQLVPKPNDTYSFETGHSIASAHTSGVLALLTQARNSNPKLQNVINKAIKGEIKSASRLLQSLHQ